MPNPQKLSPHDMAHKWVRPNETILWESKPKHCLFVHRWDIWLLTIAGALLLWLAAYMMVNGLTLIWCALLLLGLLCAVIPNVLRYRKLLKSHYLITDQRLILVVGGNLEFWEYQNIPYLERSKKWLGVTTLYLQPMADLVDSILFRIGLYQVLFWFLFPGERRTIWETGRGALVNLSDEDLEQASTIINHQLYGHKSH